MMDSLPDRPLTRNEVMAIADSESINLCKVVAELQNSSQNPVVGLYLSVNDTVHIAGYIRNQGWELITEYSETGSEPMIDRAVSDLLEWSDEHYDPSELTLGTGEDGVERAILELLPDRAVGKREIEQLDDLPEIDVVPVFAIEETSEIVCLVAFSMELDGTLVSVSLGFDREESWIVIDREQFEIGVEPDPDLAAAFEWADEQYGDDYVAIDNQPP